MIAPRVLVRIDADEGKLGAALNKLTEAQRMILDALDELRALGVLHLEEYAAND